MENSGTKKTNNSIQLNLIQIAVLKDINEAIYAVKVPHDYFSISFRDRFFPWQVIEQAVMHGIDSITVEQIKESCIVASKVLRDDIETIEKARIIDGILVYGSLHGYRSTIKACGFADSYENRFKNTRNLKK